MYITACEKRPVRFGSFLRTETWQTKTFSLPVKTVHLITTSLFSYRTAEKKEASAARAKARAQPVVSVVKKHCIVRQWRAVSEQVPRRWPFSFNPKDSRGLGKRASTCPSQINLGLTSRTIPQKKRRSSRPCEGWEVKTSFLESETAREGA